MPDESTEYGLTYTGPNIKRLDVILDEMHDDLTREWGVNTRQNPQSFLNHLLTNIADRLAELWEFGEAIYYSMYPSSAEGLNLDNAVQFGGSTRGMAARSYYHILCTGLDGTDIPTDSIIATAGNPATSLRPQTAGRITRSAFNQAAIIFEEWPSQLPMGCAINGNLYTVNTQPEKSREENLRLLADAIREEGFIKTMETDEDGTARLVIRAEEPTANSPMVLSENLTTETVGTVILFGTEETGDIFLPEGTVTVITKAPAGLQRVSNVGEYIAGRQAETDEELRQAYADEIFSRSSNMLESIRSAILQNVQGVTSCAVYENEGNVVDEMGRYPHSVEVVADGGDRTEIAQQILNTKAGGINTYGSEEVELPGLYGEPITIRFNRPVKVYIWYHVEVILSRTIFPPTNYIDMVKEQILAHMSKLRAGDSVTPQKFQLLVSGIDFMDIWLHSTYDEGEERPAEFTERVVITSPRERAYCDEDRIEVVLQDG